MSWLSRVLGVGESRSSLENPNTNLVQWLNSGNSNKSGASVTSDSTDSISAAWRATSLISGTVASLPIGVYRHLDSGRSFVKDDPITFLLNNPSPLYSKFVFWERLLLNLCKQGNGIAFIKRYEMSNPVGLELPTTPVKPIIFQNTLMYKVDGIELPLFADDVIHVVGFGDNPLWGKNVIQVHAENLGISLASNDFAATYFGNGGQISGVLQSDLKLNQEQKNAIATDWKRKYGGDNRNSTAVLDLGFKYVPIGSRPQESQLIEARKFQVEEVARIWGIPLHLLFSLDRATFNNIEVMNAVWVQHTLTLYLERIESELKRKLISKADSADKDIMFDLDGLKRGDMSARAAFYNQLFQISSISPNEIRKAEGLPTYKGGDVYYRPLNMEGIGENKNEKDE